MAAVFEGRERAGTRAEAVILSDLDWSIAQYDTISRGATRRHNQVYLTNGT